jgi:hypothetical protein
MIWHFNGATWHRYQDLSNPLLAVLSVASDRNTAVAVGADFSGISSVAVVIVGKRR